MDRGPLRRLLSAIPYGIYIVTAREGNKHVTMLATWLSQASFHPPLITLALESDSRMLRAIRGSGFFSINLLPAGGKRLASIYLKPAESADGTIAGRPFTTGPNGSAFLADALGTLECRLHSEAPAGDHALIVGEILHAVAEAEGEALTLKETGWKYQK